MEEEGEKRKGRRIEEVGGREKVGRSWGRKKGEMNEGNKGESVMGVRVGGKGARRGELMEGRR